MYTNINLKIMIELKTYFSQQKIFETNDNQKAWNTHQPHLNSRNLQSMGSQNAKIKDEKYIM